MFKIGIDVHGVLTENPEFWVKFAKSVKSGHGEIHIISGMHWNIDVEKKLLGYNNDTKWWDHYFSIEDYLDSKHLPYHYDENGGKIYDIEEWNRAKGEYCKMNNISIHFDDSPVYGKYFETRYFRIDASTDLHIITKVIELILIELIANRLKE